MSIPVRAVQTPVMENGCNMLLKFFKRVSNVHPLLFRAAVWKLLQIGLGKSRNILIIVNCTKTFLLRPIELLFDTFCTPLINKYACTPSINKYAWIVLDGKEVIFLNNFWCSCKLIPWEAFLVLLEREGVHFPIFLWLDFAAKNVNLSHIQVFCLDIFIVLTCLVILNWNRQYWLTALPIAIYSHWPDWS